MTGGEVLGSSGVKESFALSFCAALLASCRAPRDGKSPSGPSAGETLTSGGTEQPLFLFALR